MEVIGKQEKLLLNSEVYKFVCDAVREEASISKQRHGNDLQDLYTIDKELRMYLEKAPGATDTPEQLHQLVERTRSFGLYRIEIIMIANNRPENLAELATMVEQIEARFTPEQQDELISIVTAVFA